MRPRYTPLRCKNMYLPAPTTNVDNSPTQHAMRKCRRDGVRSAALVVACCCLPSTAALTIGGIGSSCKVARIENCRSGELLLAAGSAGSYRVSLLKPLGIQFEEVTPGKPEGVVVSGLVEGGNAEANGRILVGDQLLRLSAVSFGGQSALVTIGTGQQ